MSETATLVFTATPNPSEAAAMQEYVQRATPILVGAGGKMVSRTMVQEVIAGTPNYKIVLLMTFDSMNSARAVFESAAYQEIIPLRDRGFARIDISLTQEF